MLNIDSNIKFIEKKELHLIINSSSSRFKEFIVSNDTKIKNIKMEIELKIGLITDEQALSYQGEILEDEKELREYEIINYSVIDIIVRLRGGMRIFVQTPNENIFAFIVENCEKIIDLKLKIEKLIGIKIYKQILTYQNKLLDDAKSFDKYKIVDKSLIFIKRGVLIFANQLNGKYEKIYVHKSDKISDIKIKFQEKIGLHPDEQILLYQTRILEDDKTIEDYQIDEKSVINNVARLKDGMLIFAKTLDGKTVPFYIQKSDKIRDIKIKIQEKIGLHPDEQKLVYQGAILWKDKTVEDYQIAEKSVINVLVRPRGAMRIFAKTMGVYNRIMAFEIQKDEKISHIKKIIGEKFGFASNKQDFFYQDAKLMDDKTADYYQIDNESVIMICLKLMGGGNGIFIFAKTLDGKTVPFYVQKSDKISDIKIKIQEKIGLHPDGQILVYQGAILGEDKTIEDYQIEEKSVINIYDNQKTIIINTKIADGQTVKLIVDINDKISNIKMRLYQKINFHPFKQILYYDNKILENHKTIGEYLTIVKSQVLSDEKSINILLRLGDKNVLQFKFGEIRIADAKLRIQTKLQCDRELKKLIIHSKQLKDDKLLYEIFVMDRSEFRIYSNFEMLHLFIKAIKEGLLTDIQKYYKESFLEMKHGLYSRSPLLYACKFGHKEIIKYFIENKCNLESFDFELRRALHYAVYYYKNNTIIKLLMDNNVEINVPDSCGRMPIHLACQMNNVKAAKLLMKNKCDINSLDHLNQSPLKIAEKGRYETLINLLKEYKIISTMAHEMQLECVKSCYYRFCFKSFYCKTFEKVFKIDSGGFGKVYLIKESMSGRKFAVKRIKKDLTQSKYIETNINEFKYLLSHERIIKYFGAYQIENKHFIFMEFLESGSLSEKIVQVTPMAYNIILSYTKQLLEALKFLHGNNIIHQDIKPKNILLDIKRNLKLIDFGQSLLLPSVAEETQNKKEIGTFCGTSYYIAPEILNDEPHSYSADIWSLGATVIEMSTGKRPNYKFNQLKAMFQVLETRRIEYELPRNMPTFIKILIDKMLEPDKFIRVSASVLLDIVISESQN